MSETRDYCLFIEDILIAIQKIEKYTYSETFESFSKNDMAIDAVIRNFEIIGEAANHVPKDEISFCGMERNDRLRKCHDSWLFSDRCQNRV